MVNLNVVDFNKWCEWDGMWSMKLLMWVTREELRLSGYVIMCYKPITEQTFSHITIKTIMVAYGLKNARGSILYPYHTVL